MTQAAPSSDNPRPPPAHILSDSDQFNLPPVPLAQVHLGGVIGQRCLVKFPRMKHFSALNCVPTAAARFNITRSSNVCIDHLGT